VLLILLGLVELNFYQEFHQRLNALVFQYLQEDPKTVLSMLWYGFPVVKLLLALALISVIFIALLRAADKASRLPAATTTASHPALLLQHALVFALCVALSVLAARGTLRQGPPLRWGDAFTTESVFANHLGLNGALSLWTAAKARYLEGNKRHRPAMPEEQATALARQLLLTANDELVDKDSAVIRRTFTPPADGTLPVRNVVVILMESFAAHFVGALGSDAGITPEFDKIAKEGLLFTNFFSNDTHTHQGLFASMACFPNLPGFEYLMQMPEFAVIKPSGSDQTVALIKGNRMLVQAVDEAPRGYSTSKESQIAQRMARPTRRLSAKRYAKFARKYRRGAKKQRG